MEGNPIIRMSVGSDEGSRTLVKKETSTQAIWLTKVSSVNKELFRLKLFESLRSNGDCCKLVFRVHYRVN